MDAFKLSVKLFAQQDVFEPSEFLPIFHHWIQTHKLPDHLLIDVADYAHVPDGPGTVLITSQANLSTDRGAGRFGLLYFRKQPIEGAGTFRDRLQAVIAWTLKAAALLEAEPTLKDRLKFRTDELLIRINDRLLAPNTLETFAAVKQDVQAIADAIFGTQSATIEYRPSALTLFEVGVRAKESVPLKTLIERSVAHSSQASLASL